MTDKVTPSRNDIRLFSGAIVWKGFFWENKFALIIVSRVILD